MSTLREHIEAIRDAVDEWESGGRLDFKPLDTDLPKPSEVSS